MAAKVKYLDRSVADVIAWSKGQSAKPDRSWKGMCLSHCRTAYGVKPFAPSAIAAWRRIPAEFKHRGSPKDAPRGAILYYAGGKFGHAALAAGIKSSDKCLSNDYVRQGEIDFAPRTFDRWGLQYLGWSNWTPEGLLDLKSK